MLLIDNDEGMEEMVSPIALGPPPMVGSLGYGGKCSPYIYLCCS